MARTTRRTNSKKKIYRENPLIKIRLYNLFLIYLSLKLDKGLLVSMRFNKGRNKTHYTNSLNIIVDRIKNKRFVLYKRGCIYRTSLTTRKSLSRGYYQERRIFFKDERPIIIGKEERKAREIYERNKMNHVLIRHINNILATYPGNKYLAGYSRCLKLSWNLKTITDIFYIENNSITCNLDTIIRKIGNKMAAIISNTIKSVAEYDIQLEMGNVQLVKRIRYGYSIQGINHTLLNDMMEYLNQFN